MAEDTHKAMHELGWELVRADQPGIYVRHRTGARRDARQPSARVQALLLELEQELRVLKMGYDESEA